MNSTLTSENRAEAQPSGGERAHALSRQGERAHALDAVRGFALLLGVAFHAALSFMPGMPPGLWAMNDSSPSALLSDGAFVTHIFRMSLFFFIAGYFGRLLHQKRGTGGFWANRGMRIGLPLVIGWVVIWPMLALIWKTGLMKLFPGAPLPAPPLPDVTGWFPLTHLWFLYQLLLTYAAVLLVRAVIVKLDGAQKLRGLADKVVVLALRSNLATFTLGIPLAVALMGLPMWFYWQGIPTPDQSLIPLVPASVGYGTAFVFGWLVHRSGGALEAITKRWAVNLFFAVLATAWMLHIVHTEPMAQPGFTKNAFAYVFGVAAWGWALGLTGAALRFLSNYSAVRRYIADASYWVYLAHLPVVAALQVWVGKWPLHWGVKYPLVLVLSFALLFVSYHLLVRSTPIGQLLNGRRVRRGVKSSTAAPAPLSTSPSPSTPASGAAPSAIASLRRVVKRFGQTTALAGVDLEVRPGELLALLGPNGAGKTTAIGLWLGLTEPDEGEVSMFGGSPQDLDRRRQLGVMMQDVELVKELRVRELVALAASYYANPMTIDEVLAFTGTAQLAGRLYGKLSGGQKRQVQFALAVVGRPRLVFLDEPTVGLDVQARAALWVTIRKLLADGCAVVLTTHYLEEAEALATRVAVIAKGRVIATGSVADMRAMVARRQIRCESSLADGIVRTWEGVLEVARDGERLLITCAEAENVVRRLLAADPLLKRLEVREAGLTEAFNELTREAA
jgi:ABC-type multidrug transport system ATPase subunit/peptidoglycan/LPS O-acetylase OafA/YrhL